MSESIKKKSKEEVIEQLSHQARLYFVPNFGTVEADTLEEAVEKVKKKKEEDGDAN